MIPRSGKKLRTYERPLETQICDDIVPLIKRSPNPSLAIPQTAPIHNEPFKPRTIPKTLLASVVSEQPLPNNSQGLADELKDFSSFSYHKSRVIPIPTQQLFTELSDQRS